MIYSGHQIQSNEQRDPQSTIHKDAYGFSAIRPLARSWDADAEAYCPDGEVELQRRRRDLFTPSLCVS